MHTHVVVSEPDEVVKRLEVLGVSEALLKEAINQGHLQRARLTPNHPRIFAGLEMWGWCVAGLRDQLRPLGWVAHVASNYESTVNDRLDLAIAVASGDEATGFSHLRPSNRSKKGLNTVDAVEANRQGDLFLELLPAEKLSGPSNHDTWILLHHTDVLKKEIRMEFSKPWDIGSDGKITSWAERIILSSISFDDDILLGELIEPDGMDININITRKVS
jgi:hypothetical protein